MTDDLSWVPPGVDTKRANVARVYDYWLGGSHNFLADQDAARATAAVQPSVRMSARANRAFLGRAVRFLAANGIRQFLDIGSGIPTEGNVHEIAQRADPDARIVYADVDPVAVAHSRALLDGSQGAAVIEADLREPAEILRNATVRGMIDFAQPVGLLLVAVLHFLADADDPWRIVATLRDPAVLRRVRPRGARPRLHTGMAARLAPGRARRPEQVLGPRRRRPQALVAVYG
jgi:hypothetical protein